jgi:hypothetical protein
VEFLIAIIALVLLVVVILVISAPLRAGRWSASEGEPAEEGTGERRGPAGDGRSELATEHGVSDRSGVDRDAVGQDGIGPAERRTDLEAAREAKYREIRDTELDYRTGKLSQEDFTATDNALRAEAVEILDWLEALDEEEGEGGDAS